MRRFRHHLDEARRPHNDAIHMHAGHLFHVMAATKAAFLSVAMQTSKQLVARDHFSPIGFCDTGLELGQLLGREMNVVFTLACENEDVSSVLELRIV